MYYKVKLTETPPAIIKIYHVITAARVDNVYFILDIRHRRERAA